MVRKALLGLIMLAAPAMAQDSSTNCYKVGNTVQCDTRSAQSGGVNWNLNRPPPPPDYMASIRQGEEDAQRRRQMEEDQDEARRGQQDALAAQDLRKSVAASLMAGNCHEAIDTALAHGDISLAAQAKSYCATPAK